MVEQDARDKRREMLLGLWYASERHPLTAEIALSGATPTPFPYLYVESDVAKFFGMDQRMLGDFRKQHVVKPEDVMTTAHRGVYLYTPQEVLRVACAKKIWEREKHGRGGWTLADVRDEVMRDGWLERNISLIQEVLPQSTAQRKTSVTGR